MNHLPQTPDNFVPFLHLVYADPAFPAPGQEDFAAQIRPFDAQAYTRPTVDWQIRSPEKCLGDLHFGRHQVQVSGLAHPLPPEVVDRTIRVSMWQAQIKAGLRQHQSHLSLVYRGDSPNPVERMVALYQAAHTLKNENLLGVVNEPAWTAHPAADFLNREKITGYSREIPFILWIGYVRIFVDKQSYWLVTKGHHLFDVPDLAWFIESAEEEERVINRFINLFYYLFEQDVVVQPGDTLEIGQLGESFQFSEVTEYTETLMGPAGTLVIKKKELDEQADQASSAG